MIIYIVEGNTGEYSDRCNWLVKAFTCQQKAEEFRDFLSSKLKELELDRRDTVNWKERKAKGEEMKKHDPNFYTDYTSSHYCLLNVEMDEL